MGFVRLGRSVHISVKSHIRGHKIEFINNQWIYSDTREPTVQNERACGYCSLPNTPEGHDACLGTLNGIMNACCGHGQTNQDYVQFWDGHGVRGEDAKTIQFILKKWSHESTVK